MTTSTRASSRPAVIELASACRAPLVPHAEAVLAGQPAPHPSEAAARAVGTSSVAEASVLASGARLVLGKRASAHFTVAVGELVERDPAGLEHQTDVAHQADLEHHGLEHRGLEHHGLEHHDLEHHGDVEARGARLDLAVNVAVPSPPPFVAQAIERALPQLAVYPDQGPTTRRAAHHLQLEPDRLLLTNGAAQAFSLLAHARRWTEALIVQPQFTEPEAALRAADVPVQHHVLSAEDRFSLRPDLVPTAPDLVVVGHPVNPTSVLFDRSDVLALRRPGRVLVVDEAFIDASSDPSQSLLQDRSLFDPEVAEREGEVVVVRSLTKTYGLAGLRAGLVVSTPALVERLERLQGHWSVNALALSAVDAVLTDEGDAFAQQTARRLHRNALHIAAALSDAGLQVVPPNAPFVLARHDQARLLRVRLRDKGIAVRRGDTFPGLGPQWLRFAARDPEVVEELTATLRPILDELGR
ncbi:hypothetical protein GCM10025862_14060 [Arsenicicoccus piscis]|uniref:Aminotransferase n=1 Tax=Arsenicicoccus piscis TaxID=673954 RepID=A0ABQ6HMM0_9MICO|nr:hypothetical protein GCM10025862_14060 [Arsenicicoccus piscis]